jgi:hypothetical protein
MMMATTTATTTATAKTIGAAAALQVDDCEISDRNAFHNQSGKYFENSNG